MTDRRHANKEWVVCDGVTNVTFDGAQLAVLMDIRDQLKILNNLLHCQNFIDIPWKLERVARNTAKLERVARNTAKPRKPAKKAAR
jgi:hypothetical protein